MFRKIIDFFFRRRGFEEVKKPIAIYEENPQEPFLEANPSSSNSGSIKSIEMPIENFLTLRDWARIVKEADPNDVVNHKIQKMEKLVDNLSKSVAGKITEEITKPLISIINEQKILKERVDDGFRKIDDRLESIDKKFDLLLSGNVSNQSSSNQSSSYEESVNQVSYSETVNQVSYEEPVKSFDVSVESKEVVQQEQEFSKSSSSFSLELDLFSSDKSLPLPVVQGLASSYLLNSFRSYIGKSFSKSTLREELYSYFSSLAEYFSSINKVDLPLLIDVSDADISSLSSLSNENFRNEVKRLFKSILSYVFEKTDDFKYLESSPSVVILSNISNSINAREIAFQSNVSLLEHVVSLIISSGYLLRSLSINSQYVLHFVSLLALVHDIGKVEAKSVSNSRHKDSDIFRLFDDSNPVHRIFKRAFYEVISNHDVIGFEGKVLRVVKVADKFSRLFERRIFALDPLNVYCDSSVDIFNLKVNHSKDRFSEFLSLYSSNSNKEELLVRGVFEFMGISKTINLLKYIYFDVSKENRYKEVSDFLSNLVNLLKEEWRFDVD
ncbi:MAG TPA: hypothetical protein ENO30_02015 [Thermodesulfobium narugense]|nr:hypothetical protein [Thermodesulfobium narugense]